MKHSPIANSSLLLTLSLVLCSSAFAKDEAVVTEAAPAREIATAATEVAPLHAVARYLPTANSYAWSLHLKVPKVVWEARGKGPAVKDPSLSKEDFWHLKSEVRMVELELSMGYSKATALSEAFQNRLVDLDGKRLSEQEVKQRLASYTPVLLAVNGKMPEPFYLQCLAPDTLMVLVGESTPALFNLLPTAKAD